MKKPTIPSSETRKLAQHIAQKYRLAISIAILNTKPENLNDDEYIDQLKSIIRKKNINNDQNDDDDANLNISACSDDFNMHSSDENDFNDNDQEYMNQNRLSHDLKDKGSVDPTKSVSENLLNTKKKTSNKTLFNDEDQFNEANDGSLDNGDHNARVVLHNFEDVLDVNKVRREKFREVIQVMKGDDVIPMDQVIVDETRHFCSDNSQTKLFDPMDLDLTQCYEENYGTLSNSINKLTNIDNRGYEQIKIQHFETNQTRQDIEQISKDASIIASQRNNTDITNQNEKFKGLKTAIIKRMKDIKEITTSNTETANKDHNVENAELITKSTTNTTTVNDDGNFTSNDSLQLTTQVKEARLNTHNTIPEYSQYNTHYSGSEMDEVNIDNKLLYSRINQNQTKENANLKDVGNEFNISYQQIIQSNRERQNDIAKNNIGIDSAFSLDAQIQYPNYESQTSQILMQNDTAYLIDIVNASLDRNNQIERNSSYIENGAIDSQDQSMGLNDNTFQPKTHDFDEATVSNSVISDKIANVDNNDKEEDKRVKISFKIIEEMNRIQVYLKRKELSGCSSSYRSSQSFGFLRSSQSENVAIEQSAYSIFNYIATCPLVTAAQVLTEQISEVLGQLVDRLHEKEMYPTFIEDMLNTIKDTLKLVYEEENYAFDVLFNKDEQIQRILLLNKSTHIQKFTIEKINNILQKLLDETSADSTSEILNINRMENLCYVFHVLQIILPKYIANYLKPSQNSQEDKILRKTGITEVWRKKWTANFKEISNEGSLENNCVLKECSEILNKIVVGFMDGYSLIAFSALQCYNLIQS